MPKRGNTATINIVAFRAQWEAHVPISALCVNFSCTKDQVIRLKGVYGLQPRHNRRLRFKPGKQRDPTPREIAQACRELQAGWDERTREERRVTKTKHVQLRRVELTDDAREAEGHLLEPDE